MIVRNHMSTPPITVSPETDFKVAMDLMQRHRIRRLPVVDGSGLLAGIVAERDLLGAADRYLQSVADVGEIMTRSVVTVERGTPVVEAASLMIGLKIGGLPVVDESNKVLGIITETDLMKALVDMLAEEKPRKAATAKPAGTKRAAKKRRPAKAAAPKKRRPKRATRKSRTRT
ncbi:MAG TPA: CBS domain-containing protein [Casimicrobiaceae bacterium]|nr:CBS domain-containing protein [Casimicrobiaceae bacterium]